MAENNTSAEYNLNESSDSKGYKNEDIRDNESIVPDSDPNSSEFKVPSVVSSEISSDHTDFGGGWDDKGPITVNDATVIASANILNWTTNFTDISVEPFTQDSGPSLPENCDISVAKALDYLSLFFKPEIFRDIKDHTTNYTIFKQEKIGGNRNNHDYFDSVWQGTHSLRIKSHIWHTHFNAS